MSSRDEVVERGMRLLEPWCRRFSTDILRKIVEEQICALQPGDKIGEKKCVSLDAYKTFPGCGGCQSLARCQRLGVCELASQQGTEDYDHPPTNR